MSEESTEDLKRRLLQKRGAASPDLCKGGLSSGSTLINLACSGRSNVCFLPGHYYLIVGDSASGKSFISLTCLAEAALNPHFAEYRFIYDNTEDGALMDFATFFGEKMAGRVEAPGKTPPLVVKEKKGNRGRVGGQGDGNGTSIAHSPSLDRLVHSTTVEEFYFHLDDACNEGSPFIYILDSMDSLTSEDEEEKFKEHKLAHRKGKEVAGSYGDGKAKKNASGIRQALHKLKKTGSILIVITQTRDNLGFGFEKKTRSGGRALRFYATLELWSAVKEKIRKRVKGKDRQLGIIAEIQVKKNRLTGRERKVQIPIFHSFGMDDVGSCIDYLIDEGHWSGSKDSIEAREFEFQGSREDLITKIDEEDLLGELRAIVAKVWGEIEEACAVERRSRYHQ